MLQVKRRRPGEQLSQVPLGGKQSCREARGSLWTLMLQRELAFPE